MIKDQHITTIIFDLGGVIVNLDWDRCVRNFNQIGISGMENLVSTTLQRGFILDYEVGKITTTQFRNELRKYASQEVSDDEIDFAWTSLLVDVPEKKLQLLLDLKKKYRILMLSNTNEMSFEYCKKHFFNTDGKTIADYFDKCYLSYELHQHKPEPDIFETLLTDSGLQPRECLFLDDGIHNIKTAVQLGIQGKYIEPYSDIQLPL